MRTMVTESGSRLIASLLLVAGMGIWPFIAQAAPPGPIPVDLRVELGSPDNQLRFFPDTLELTAGTRYRLTLHNPSATPHYFTATELFRNVFTEKVIVLGQTGQRLGEVKGMILDLEVYPGGTIEWWFIPARTLDMGKLSCSLAGHAEKGMVGTISIK